MNLTTCKYCSRTTPELGITNSGMAGHSRFCDKNPKRKIVLDGYKQKLSDLIKSGEHINSVFLKKLLDSRVISLDEAKAHNKKYPLRVKLSEETKKKISFSRKRFLKENPDQHPWKNKKFNQSAPCDKIKEVLIERGLNFVEEITPLKDRSFSIDIAFPKERIGIEVNGNQHYGPDGNLSAYYQTRHDLIVASGWTLYEIHYSIAHNQEKLNEILDSILMNVSSYSSEDMRIYITEIQAASKKAKEKRVNEKLQKIQNKESILADKKERIMLIDFNKKQWTHEAAIILDIGPNSVRKWLRKNMSQSNNNLGSS